MFGNSFDAKNFLTIGLFGILAIALGLASIGAVAVYGPAAGIWAALAGLLPLLVFLLFVIASLGNNAFRLSIAINIVFLCLVVVWLRRASHAASPQGI